MKWWKKIALSGAGLFFLVLGEGTRECRGFRMTHYHPERSNQHPNGPTNENRIVFLSDLHNRVYGSQNDILLEKIRKARPGLILIGGDMLIGKKNASPEHALDFIRRLPEIAPVYYALGNHEQRLKSQVEKYGDVLYYYRKKLTAAGIHFLENESADVTLSGRKIRITGLALPLDTYTHKATHGFCSCGRGGFRPAWDTRKASVTGRDIRKLAGPADKSRYQILLAHNPSYVPAYKEWGANLVLCGHLHGGVLRIPGWRGVVTPQATLFPKYSGEMTVEDGTTVVVSKGLGTHTVNLRVFNPAEVVVLHI